MTVLVMQLPHQVYTKLQMVQVHHNLIEELLSVDENKTNTLTAYPSPFTTTLNLSFNQLTNGTLSIFDVNGKLIHSETISNSNTTTINTLEFTKGVYFYKLVDTSTGLGIGKGKVFK